jgi:hypothetical protein
VKGIADVELGGRLLGRGGATAMMKDRYDCEICSQTIYSRDENEVHKLIVGLKTWYVEEVMLN